MVGGAGQGGQRVVHLALLPEREEVVAAAVADSRDVGLADRRNRTLVLAGVGLVMAAVALDSTVTSLALPTIRNDLGARARSIPWIASFCFFAASRALVPAGRMVDVVSARMVRRVGVSTWVSARR